jgi:hypothetical protein
MLKRQGIVDKDPINVDIVSRIERERERERF